MRMSALWKKTRFGSLLWLGVLMLALPAAAASAEKAPANFAQVLDGFDKLLFAGKYAEAAAHVKSAAATFATGPTAAQHKAATAIAAYLVKCDAARAAALKKLAGKKISVRYKSGALMTGVFKSISGDILRMTVRYKLGAGWTESPRKVALKDLAAGELDRLLPCPAPGSADEHVAAAITALGRDDFEAAEAALKAGGASALAARYDARLKAIRKARAEQLAAAAWQQLAAQARSTFQEAQAKLFLAELQGFEQKWGATNFATGKQDEIKKLRGKAKSATNGGTPGSTRWPQLLRSRTPLGRRAAIAKYGGSAATEKTVEAALAWLARHQEKDGSWNHAKFGGRSSFKVTTGCTALAMLAMLGAGNTDTHGKYAANVKRAQNWLMTKQRDNGGIADGDGTSHMAGVGYCHPMSSLALAESLAMGGDRRLVAAVAKAVKYSVEVFQNPNGGWRYSPKSKGDTSVTAWFVAHLVAARRAGLKVPASGFAGAATYFKKATRDDGSLGYTARSKSGKATMTAAAAFARRQMGIPASDPSLVKGMAVCLKYLPDWEKASRRDGRVGTGQSLYYWYHATNAMFQLGGKSWGQWNAAVIPALTKNQRRGGPVDGSDKDVDGSWDPQDSSDKAGGRIYTAAMGALILETYYRYKPLGKVPDTPAGPIATEPATPEPVKPEPPKPEPDKPNLDIPGDEEPG